MGDNGARCRYQPNLTDRTQVRNSEEESVAYGGGGGLRAARVCMREAGCAASSLKG